MTEIDIFDKQFPSLKYHHTSISKGIYTFNFDFNCIDVGFIQDYCLDKQIVKEVIIKYRDLIYDACGSDYSYNEVLMELGLNEESNKI